MVAIEPLRCPLETGRGPRRMSDTLGALLGTIRQVDDVVVVAVVGEVRLMDGWMSNRRG